jgi:hypothetical protein
MSDFWERQRAKVAAQNPPPSPPVSDVPWWAQGTNLVPHARQPENAAPAQPQGQADTNRIDGHDISRAEFLRGKAEECPQCPVNPDTGIRGNMFKTSSSAAWRCFDCGYVDGREIHDISLPITATAEGPARRARQIEGQGFTADPYAHREMPRQGIDS